MLARLRKMADREDEGFTLIELLVVIIIIGILAAIAIPVFLSQKSKGYEASMKSDLRTAAQSIESANVDGQDYTGVTWTTGKTMGTATAGTTGTLVTNAAPNVGNDAIKLSPGNTLNIVGVNSTAYCIEATSTKTSATWFYSSDKGGLLPSTSACTSTAP